jgi:hypothetical protein
LTSTDERGAFRFEGIPAGRYTPVAALLGFQEHVHASIEVSDGQVYDVPITLQLAIMEQIRVEGRSVSRDVLPTRGRTRRTFRLSPLKP